MTASDSGNCIFTSVSSTPFCSEEVGGEQMSCWVGPPAGKEYAASSDRKSGRLEMCEVVDSRSANKASMETRNKDFTYLNHPDDSIGQKTVKVFGAGHFLDSETF